MRSVNEYIRPMFILRYVGLQLCHRLITTPVCDVNKAVFLDIVGLNSNRVRSVNALIQLGVSSKILTATIVLTARTQ